jgi:DNA-binding transcriptional ArsR family regulator
MNSKQKLVYDARAKVLKALAHPTRLWIVEKLLVEECCVCEFVNKVDSDFSTISKHLSVLRQAGIIESEKRGKNVFYKLKIPCILKFVDCIDSVIRQQAKEQAQILD